MKNDRRVVTACVQHALIGMHCQDEERRSAVLLSVQKFVGTIVETQQRLISKPTLSSDEQNIRRLFWECVFPAFLLG